MARTAPSVQVMEGTLVASSVPVQVEMGEGWCAPNEMELRKLKVAEVQARVRALKVQALVAAVGSKCSTGTDHRDENGVAKFNAHPRVSELQAYVETLRLNPSQSDSVGQRLKSILKRAKNKTPDTSSDSTPSGKPQASTKDSD